MNKFLNSLLLLLTPALFLQAEEILIEAESFSEHGGWKLDTQFIREMGSPYLLAHGLGEPVRDAKTTFQVKNGGTYQLFARTKDWVARWKAEGQPGRFQIKINGQRSKLPSGLGGPNGTGRREERSRLGREKIPSALEISLVSTADATRFF